MMLNSKGFHVICLYGFLIGLVLGVSVNGAASDISSSNNFCQGCRSLVSFSRTFNSSQNRPEYRNILKNYCENFYPPSTDYQDGPCALFVEGFYTVLDHVDPIHHCDQIGACGPSTTDVTYPSRPQVMNTTPKQADIICKFCEDSIAQVKASLSDPKTIDQVRRQANLLCDYLKVVEADKECRQLVNKYLDQAIDFIKSINPLDYCRSVQMCPMHASSNALSRVLEAAPVASNTWRLPTLADFSDFGIETSVIIGNEKSPKHESQTKTPNCLLCKTLVKEMFHFLRQNKTEENIVKGLNQVCHALFARDSNLLDECQSMVDAYTDELIKLLIDETDPELICMMLELCHYEKTPSYKLLLPKEEKQVAVQSIEKKMDFGELLHALDPTTKLKSAKICIECKFFIRYLKSMIDEPTSRDYIKNWLLTNLCGSIQDQQISSQCRSMIERYADTFFMAVSGSLNPKVACSDLGACNRQTLSEVLRIDTLAPIDKPDQLPTLTMIPKNTQPRKAVSSAAREPSKLWTMVQETRCDECIQIVTQIDDYLSRHPVDDDVSVIIDNVCNMIPERSTQQMCTFVVKKLGKDLVEVVTSMESPRQFCKTLWLCSNE